MAHFQPENLCRRFCQRAYAVTFRRVMPCRNESRTRFIGEVVLGFGNFTRQIQIDAFIYCRLKKALCTAGTPCDPSDFAFGFADGDRLTLQNCFNMRRQCAECLGLFQAARVEQVLFAEPFSVAKPNLSASWALLPSMGCTSRGRW